MLNKTAKILLDNTTVWNFDKYATDSVTGNAIQYFDKCHTVDYAYSKECLYKALCPQFNNYFVKFGLGIIIAYILISWGLWAFFKYRDRIFKGTKYYTYWSNIDNCIYWDNWVRARMSKLLIGFIVVVVYLSLRGG